MRQIAPMRWQFVLRSAAFAALTSALCACTVLRGNEGAPREGFALNAANTIGRPEWLHRLIAKMDAEAIPGGMPLPLKLSFELAPESLQVVRAASPSHL
jgi:hypothetical protein